MANAPGGCSFRRVAPHAREDQQGYLAVLNEHSPVVSFRRAFFRMSCSRTATATAGLRAIFTQIMNAGRTYNPGIYLDQHRSLLLCMYRSMPYRRPGLSGADAARCGAVADICSPLSVFPRRALPLHRDYRKRLPGHYSACSGRVTGTSPRDYITPRTCSAVAPALWPSRSSAGSLARWASRRQP